MIFNRRVKTRIMRIYIKKIINCTRVACGSLNWQDFLKIQPNLTSHNELKYGQNLKLRVIFAHALENSLQTTSPPPPQPNQFIFIRSRSLEGRENFILNFVYTGIVKKTEEIIGVVGRFKSSTNKCLVPQTRWLGRSVDSSVVNRKLRNFCQVVSR